VLSATVVVTLTTNLGGDAVVLVIVLTVAEFAVLVALVTLLVILPVVVVVVWAKAYLSWMEEVVEATVVTVLGAVSPPSTKRPGVEIRVTPATTTRDSSRPPAMPLMTGCILNT